MWVGPEFKLVALTSLNSPANLNLDTFSLEPECAGDKFGRTWHSPTSRPGTGGFLYPCVQPSVLISLSITLNSMGAVDKPNGDALNWYVFPGMKSKVFPGLFLYWYVEVGFLKIY